QPSVPHVWANIDRMRDCSGGTRFIHAGFTPQKGSRSRNEGRAEGSSPSRSIGAKRISGYDSFTGGIYPHDGVTVVGEIGALIHVIGGGDSHHVASQRGRVYGLCLAIVPRRRGTNDALLTGVVQGFG